mgnify:CR=1 FL=1|jgi:molecular chaperone GrpE
MSDRKTSKEEMNSRDNSNTSDEEKNNEANHSAHSSEEKNEEQTVVKEIEVNVDFKDRYLRIYADFENYRKRTSKERLELFSTANQELMTAMLPVLDDFERATKQLPENEDSKAFVEGIKLIQDKYRNTLVQKGLRSLEIKPTDLFDVELMEAITKIPAPMPEMKGAVVDVIEQGYKLGEKVIRFAKVVVGE